VTAVVAKSFARIHRANLVNFGIVPLLFSRPEDYDTIGQGTELRVAFHELRPGGEMLVGTAGGGPDIAVHNDLTASELAILRSGGLLNDIRKRKQAD
jgi:aconitate hydratase